MGTYVFDNSWERERERLAGLESTLDPGTTRHLDALGVTAGWTCLEVAGGGGSVALWLCRRVGRSGRVVATDLDTRFLDAIAEPNLEVLRHDVVADDIPEATFDIIHTRLLLEHLPPREHVLRRLIAALKPGAWILIEDLDWRGLLARPPMVVQYPAADTRRSTKVWRGVVTLMCSAGYDPMFGAKLLPLLMDLGLEEVSAEARNPMIRGATSGSGAPRWTLEQLKDQLVSKRLVSEREIDQEIVLADDPKHRRLMPTMIATWGRRPLSDGKMPSPGSLPARSSLVSERLHELSLFAGCTHDEIKLASNLAAGVEVNTGSALTREGETGDLFYVIIEGTATVTRGGEKLATLGPGSFFGETALLTGGPRTATVTADMPMVLASFDRQAFDAILGESRTIARRILEGVAARVPGGTAQLYP